MSFIGRAFEDPSGLVLGHVVAVEPDGTGGVFLTVHGEWGALDWLHLLGSSRQETHNFRFHSTEVESVGHALRLKADVLIERKREAELEGRVDPDARAA